jgi:hypothetical protein
MEVSISWIGGIGNSSAAYFFREKQEKLARQAVNRYNVL